MSQEVTSLGNVASSGEEKEEEEKNDVTVDDVAGMAVRGGTRMSRVWEITYRMCAETCIRVIVKTWSGVNDCRARSAAGPRNHCYQARSPPRAIFTINIYH